MAEWARGVKAMVAGDADCAVSRFNRAIRVFERQNNRLEIAQTQVAELYALALLGRCDEAIEIGKNALVAGFADARAPLIEIDARELTESFDEAQVLTGDDASFVKIEKLCRAAPPDVLNLGLSRAVSAC